MLPTTLRNALLSIAALLPAHVLADDDDSSDVVTFQFSACVSTCLGTTGYSMDGEDNQKEMCKASRDGLLEAIIACTVSDCPEDLGATQSNLLQPMQTGCKELEKPVSDDEIEDAASAAANIQATLAATTTIAKPTSAGNAITQAQQTTAPEQAPVNNPGADVTSSAEASKTEGSKSKATHVDAGDDKDTDKDEDKDDDDDKDDDETGTSATYTATPDISGELVLATGTPTAASSGFATSVTAVTAVPSASGTQTAVSDDVDGGLGGGSPFSVVTASAAPGSGPSWWAPLCVTLGMAVPLMLYHVLLTPDFLTNINTKPQNCDPKAPIGGGVPPDGNEKSKHAQT
ncbi:hypothetical protein UCDDA912_g07967 [Diaporthe ampelina]|uniref:Uncharacterized protein n=1 Tax=Diaporthe ampelina TaxID=1214573 RepID=A0A0G2FD12_9PEZI|nr:hypothetical protein UCDDA912_g07967 [Diaporthe ampelina]